MTRRMTSCPYIPLLVLLTTTCSTATTSSSCSFSDILSNNTACLPIVVAEGSFVALPPLELQLQFNDDNFSNADNDVDASLDGIRFALEYYLNYSLSRFDDNEDAGFDDGGFAYAKVDNVAPASSSSSEPVRRLRRQTITRSLLSSSSSSWRLSVSAGAFYNLSPGGWIFSSIPTSMELLQRVQSVVEEPLEDADDNVVVGGKFAAVLKMLLFDMEGLQAFRYVMGVEVVLEEEEETGRPSLRPTWISLESTLAPTIGVLTTESSSTTQPASDSPTISSTAIMTTNGPTVSRIESSPAPSKEPTVLVTPIPTQIGIQSIEPSSQWPTVVMIKTLPPTRTNNDASPTAVMIKTLPPTRTNNDASIGDSVVSSSPSPTVAHRNGDGGSTPHSMTPSNTFKTDQNRSDAPFGLAAGTNIDSNGDDTLAIQTNGNSIDDNIISNNSNNNSQTEGNINKELLSSTSSDKNKSKIIASSTLAVSFLILVLVSGAFVIQRRGRNRKELKGDKSFPLHFLADDGLKGDGEAEEKNLSGEYLDGDHFRHELNGNATSKQHVSSSSEADFTVAAAAAATTAVLISKEEKNANNETCPTPVTPRKSKSESNLSGEMNQQNHSLDRPVRNRVRIIPSGAASSPNDSSIQNRHRSVQSTYRYSPNNAVNLSNEKSDTTPSDKNNESLMSTPSLNGYDPSYVIAHYDEERIAKKEMARELFLTKEQMKRVGRSNGTDTNLDFTMNDFGSTERILQLNSSSDVMSEDTPSLGVCYQTNNEGANIQGSPSLEYSASDAMSNDTSHRQNNQRLPRTTFNIISPSSLPSRRKHVEPQQHGTDPPDSACCRPPGLDLNDVTVVTDDDSMNGNDDHHDHTCFFPRCKEVSSNPGIDKINKGWNKCLANCAPTSFKALVSPIRHDEDDCDENNDIVRGGEKWFNHAMCGRECGDNNLRRVSPSFSNGQSDYENDWDFGDVEDEGDVKSGEDAFSIGSALS